MLAFIFSQPNSPLSSASSIHWPSTALDISQFLRRVHGLHSPSFSGKTNLISQSTSLTSYSHYSHWHSSGGGSFLLSLLLFFFLHAVPTGGHRCWNVITAWGNKYVCHDSQTHQRQQVIHRHTCNVTARSLEQPGRSEASLTISQIVTLQVCSLVWSFLMVNK